ncbi:porin family protein [Flavobacterium urocaniciphilum]|uniref:Outer membrane protein beta-barrel domain-containing protein n=1 Tax=Flavobacterium urocaniciphilum TaxID=1299341 RepID=A0A1H9AM62_9FLAO|nr:hypothetical protein [Flavobacterium urocaniciphilum]SEP77655.1 hypothetical protein SAMN05444005_102222 [Flavobacterium urocaniciphilum]
MQKIILYLSLALLATCTQVHAQTKTFEQKVKEISTKIKSISEEEKQALKLEISAIEKQVEENKITKEDAAALKTAAAEKHAANIETRVAEQEALIRDLVHGKVDVEVTNDSIKNKMKISIGAKKDSLKSENRTTSQFVFAVGYNNLVTDGAVANSEFKYNRSSFFEWGITWNTRLSKNSNLMHFKYGLGFQYNMLQASENRVLADVDNQTVLVPFFTDLRPNRTYFKNVYFVVPMHLEFDFSKTKMDGENKIFKSHRGARFGIGGFVGVNTNSKQFIAYRQDGYKITERQKGDFNVNDFTYGLSTYIGYKQTSLYLKYDLNPIFKNNPIDQNNISLGIRFDWN